MAPMPLGLPPELGPPRMRVLPARDNGREEDSRVKRRRHTPEQVTKKLREADRLVAEGQEIAEVAKALEFPSSTASGCSGYGARKACAPQRQRQRQRLGESTGPADRLTAEHHAQVWALDLWPGCASKR